MMDGLVCDMYYENEYFLISMDIFYQILGVSFPRTTPNTRKKRSTSYLNVERIKPAIHIQKLPIEPKSLII